MSGRSGSRWVWHQVLLIAMTIQGITPDLHDLASTNLLPCVKIGTLLAGRPGLAIAATQHALPFETGAPEPEPQEPDDSPDEVCVPGVERTGVASIQRTVRRNQTAPTPGLIDSGSTLVRGRRRPGRQSEARCGRFVRLSLCRLLC